MPKTKDDRRARRQEGDEPYQKGRGYRRDNRPDNRAPKHRGKSDGAAAAEDEHAPCPSFDAMNLKPDLLKGIYAYGFEKPSAIQQRAIRPIVRGRDVIAQSQSGTGKTVSAISFFACFMDETRNLKSIFLFATGRIFYC